jgi:hypothetical protein
MCTPASTKDTFQKTFQSAHKHVFVKLIHYFNYITAGVKYLKKSVSDLLTENN